MAITIAEGRAPRGQCRAFIAAAVQHGEDACLLWPYAVDINGYGIMKHEGKSTHVSRIVCEAVLGAPPSTQHEVAHRCNTPACVSPDHLRWDTHKGNMADKLTAGTHNRGERHGMSKLTVAEVRSIRASSEQSSALAVRFGVARKTIRNIRSGATWGWLTWQS